MKDIQSILLQRKQDATDALPNKKQALTFIDRLIDVLYMDDDTQQIHSEELEKAFADLAQLLNALLGKARISDETEDNWQVFYAALPDLYQKGMADAKALFDSDPAAHSLQEVIHTYPGFYAMAIHRISHYFWQHQIKLLARIFSEYVHSKTGIDIHPGAKIGMGFAIDHGTGIVIGETSEIGDRVKIYQGVTLGAFSVSKTLAQNKRHPSIGDDVVIYSNATILGGTTLVGKGSIIGGSAWLTHSVPSNSVVFHANEIKVKDNNPFPEAIHFVI